MKANMLTILCLSAFSLLCHAEIRSIDDLHDSLRDKYPDQIIKKPGLTTHVTPKERDNIVRNTLYERNANLRGKPAPDIEFKTKDGRTQRLSDLRGKPVIVVFEISLLMESKTCLPHKQTAEGLHQHEQELIEKGIPVIFVEGVVPRKSPGPAVENYINATPERLKNTYYTGIAYDLDTRYPYEWGVSGYPSIQIVDGSGKVTHLRSDIFNGPDAKPIENCLRIIDKLPPAPPALPQDRDLTDNNGRKLSGTILDKDDTTIKFRRASDQKEFDIPINTLSAADQKFIRECQDAITRNE